MLEAAVGFGLLFAVFLIVIFFNPPEAFVKKMFKKDGKPGGKGSG